MKAVDFLKSLLVVTARIPWSHVVGDGEACVDETSQGTIIATIWGMYGRYLQDRFLKWPLRQSSAMFHLIFICFEWKPLVHRCNEENKSILEDLETRDRQMSRKHHYHSSTTSITGSLMEEISRIPCLNGSLWLGPCSMVQPQLFHCETSMFHVSTMFISCFLF